MDPAPITLIGGPNGSGKTTALLAIEEGISGTGAFPWLADRDEEAAVTMTFDGDTTLRRRFSPKHEAQVVTGSDVVTGIAGAKAWVSTHLGAAPTRMDLLSLSPAQREAALLDLGTSMPETWPDAARLAEILGPAADDVIRGAGRAPHGSGPSEWAPWLGKALTAARGAALQHGREIEAIAADLRRQADADADAEIRGTLADAQAEVEAACDEVAAASADVQVLSRLGRSVSAATAERDELRAKIAAAREALAGLQKPDTSAHDAERAAAQAAEDRADVVAESLRNAVESENEAKRREIDACREADRATDALHDIRGQLAAYRDGFVCDSCGQPVDTGCDGYARAVSREVALEHDRAHALLKVRDCEAVRKAATEARIDAAAVASTTPNVTACRQREDAAIRASMAMTAAYETKRAGIMAEGRAMAAALGSIEAALVAAPTSGDPDIARAALHGAEARRAVAQERVRAHQRAQAREEERTARARRRLDHEIARDAAKDAVDRLAELRSELAGMTTGAVEDDASWTFQRVFAGVIRFVEDSKAGLRVVIVRNGTALPVEAWSGSEAVVVGLALHLAVQRLRGAPWVVALVDNIDRLDDATLKRLVSALVQSIEEGARLDNVVLAGADGYGHYNGQRAEVRAYFMGGIE
jgi:hypothetical protein